MLGEELGVRGGARCKGRRQVLGEEGRSQVLGEEPGVRGGEERMS